LDIKRVGSQASEQGSKDYFTGSVRIDRLIDTADPARVAAASVTFEPGARTAWHTHPLGQTLVVTAGCGWAQREGGPVEEIRPGDVVWFAPHEKHWHGATSTTGMTHIAMQEKLDGKPVTWMELVSDAEYHKLDVAQKPRPSSEKPVRWAAITCRRCLASLQSPSCHRRRDARFPNPGVRRNQKVLAVYTLPRGPGKWSLDPPATGVLTVESTKLIFVTSSPFVSSTVFVAAVPFDLTSVTV
jgi:quercetin dioxygenase-like cupin family protein